VTLDPARHEVRCHESVVHLTVTEFGLLASLMERPGHVFSRAKLMERAYAWDNLITERTIDTHVKRIRRKFRDAGHDPIETVHGVGYKLRERE
jgi:two-component system OmpR family response regulator